MVNPFVRKMERHVRLAPEDRAVLDGLGRQHVRHVAARQDIEGQQSDPSHTHLILDGWACRYKQFPDGRRAIVALLLPGDLCDPFVFRRAHMDHAIGALTSVTVARIAPDQLGDAIRGRPAVEECLWREMLATTALHREWIASVGRRSAIERLAHLFCELHLRLTRVGLADGMTLPMPVTQPDLADALGQTSVHINRTLKELRISGLVALRSRRLTIRDLDGLMERGLFDPAYLQLS
ncbi:Crp/Fnr family transcriptional regulator [Methylobacterium sp. 092160098-2]|uniref:Crp/Fnr family transcriptional regulator n=1 Tax=Methylobacterium sp. 092160098-2 TaxID=3025129 RepID=UPI0023819EC3|nr:Crp/Fnr family transcriptional regulator [Methylobacterium sp. 092160098-2]MDE4913962.1 Crp/Fnr family transcriptional regulator [Methylobacterium sp. 092160098-2]